MNVLFLTRRAAPDIGGVERHISAVSANLKSQIPNIKIATITERDINPPKVKYFGLFYIWFWLYKNRKLIEDADIVHCHDVYIWYWPFRVLYIKKPSYITFHGWEGKYPVPFRFKLVKKVSEYLASGNICVGEFIEKYYGVKPDYVTYGGVSNFSNLQFSKNNKVKILYIGRLEKDTGFVEIMSALFKIKFKYPDAQIQFLGDGPLRSDAESVGDVLGFQTDVNKYLKETRFVIASGYLTILEAMAAGKIVFAFSSNQLRLDYLKPFENFVISPMFADTFVRKIQFFLKNPDQEKKLVKKAYNWAISQTWSKVAEIYLKLWQVTI
jgi:glycosyltransferase involved in cell wall biosynthesis